MAGTKGKRPRQPQARQATVESASESSEEESESISSEDPYDIQETPAASNPQSSTRSVRKSASRSAAPQSGAPPPTNPFQTGLAADMLGTAAVSPGRRMPLPRMGPGSLRVNKTKRETMPPPAAAVPRRQSRQEEEGRSEGAPRGQRRQEEEEKITPRFPTRQEAAGAVKSSRSQKKQVEGTPGVKRSQEATGAPAISRSQGRPDLTTPRVQQSQQAAGAVTVEREGKQESEAPATPVKRRRSSTGTGPSAKKRRISPKKTTTMIIPGSQLPNGAKHPLPKGTVMEMIQVRDLEVSRLMEELQNYEDEAMVLTQQIHIMSNEKLERDQQIQEMARSMADMQRAISHMRLSSAIGPRLTYWPDEKIKTYWDRLVNNVLSFAEDHCHWTIEGGADGMSQYRPDAWKLGGSAEAGHFGTFQNLMNEQEPSRLAKIGITQSYVRKLTSDGLGNSYPARLDSFVGEGQPNELIPAAMIMRILQSEVFDKLRWLLRSEPFWDPMRNPNRTSEVDWQSFKGRMTNDFVVLQERTSAHDDPSESSRLITCTFPII